MAIPATVLILTKNEESVIARTIGSARAFAQIIVVDSGSEDRTCELAAELGAEVVQFRWDGSYPKKKEWAIRNAPIAHDWVLYLDADEFVTEALATEIGDLLAESRQVPEVAFDIGLDYFFLGRRLRHGHQVTKRALVKRSVTTWPRPDDLAVPTMWEVEGHYQPSVDGATGRCAERLRHEDLDSLYDYFSRHNRYSDWEAYLRVSGTGDEIVRNRSRAGQLYARAPAQTPRVLPVLVPAALRLAGRESGGCTTRSRSPSTTGRSRSRPPSCVAPRTAVGDRAQVPSSPVRSLHGGAPRLPPTAHRPADVLARRTAERLRRLGASRPDGTDRHR